MPDYKKALKILDREIGITFAEDGPLEKPYVLEWNYCERFATIAKEEYDILYDCCFPEPDSIEKIIEEFKNIKDGYTLSVGETNNVYAHYKRYIFCEKDSLTMCILKITPEKEYWLEIFSPVIPANVLKYINRILRLNGVDV